MHALPPDHRGADMADAAPDQHPIYFPAPRQECKPAVSAAGAYLVGVVGGPRLAARSSAMIWRRFSMPSLVKAGTPSSPTPWTHRQPSSGNMLIDRSKIQFSSSPSSLAT